MKNYLINNIIPKLNRNFYKGQSGRIGIVGGSLEYTGAPYYAAISTLKSGGDLAFVICTNDAAIPIKSYSPELIVYPYLKKGKMDDINSILIKLHGLVLGPGLGRNEETFEMVMDIIESAKQLKLPLVLDGDALFLLKDHPELIQGYTNTILTPNANEFRFLYEKIIGNKMNEKQDEIIYQEFLKQFNLNLETSFDGLGPFNIKDEKSSSSLDKLSIVLLSKFLGNITILQKGKYDLISDGIHIGFSTASGSMRRCGGQGDLVAGISGLFSSWSLITKNNIHDKDNEKKLKFEINPLLYAAFGASSLVRYANYLAFEKYGRGMTTPNMIEELSKSFSFLFDEDDKSSCL